MVNWGRETMKGDKIYYRDGYKHQLAKTYEVYLDYAPEESIIGACYGFVDFFATGKLVIRKGYAWDGASGPTWDTPDCKRGSLVHDALYQLIREEYLPMDPWRLYADLSLKKILTEDGMPWWRRWYWIKILRKVAAYAADPKNRKKEIEAP